MNEKLIEKMMSDSRVVSFQIGNIHALKAIPEQVQKVIIYCHGLGANKSWMARFYEQLYEHQIGMIAFDFPGHGEDERNFPNFPLEQCLADLKTVIEYGKEYAPVYLFGCSFGGFVILNELLEHPDVKQTFLMCPAVNFCSIIEMKTGVSKKFYESHDSIFLFKNMKLTKEIYKSLKEAEEKVMAFSYSDVCIIHGTVDKTVDYQVIQKFCEKKQIKLTTLENGKHELYDFDQEIIDWILCQI